MVLGIFYEYLRDFQRKLDVRIAQSLLSNGKGKSRASSRAISPDGEQEESGLITERHILKTLPG